MRLTILCVIILLSSCRKDHEEMTYYEATLVNNSIHWIKFQPYVAGSIRLDHVIELEPYSSKQIADGFHRGRVSLGSGFNSKYFVGVDSIVVVFDDTNKITHYLNALPGFIPPKNYLFTSLRNIMNPDSYTAKVEWEKKYSERHSYTYAFTEQDYLDAQ